MKTSETFKQNTLKRRNRTDLGIKQQYIDSHEFAALPETEKLNLNGSIEKKDRCVCHILDISLLYCLEGRRRWL